MSQLGSDRGSLCSILYTVPRTESGHPHKQILAVKWGYLRAVDTNPQILGHSALPKKLLTSLFNSIYGSRPYTKYKCNVSVPFIRL